jgi:predicted RNase H-like HicB family nuclease
MLSEYIAQKLRTAAYKPLEDGTYFGEIPALSGVWANAVTLEDCRNELREVLESWIFLSLQRGEDIKDLTLSGDSRDKEHA